MKPTVDPLESPETETEGRPRPGHRHKSLALTAFALATVAGLVLWISRDRLPVSLPSLADGWPGATTEETAAEAAGDAAEGRLALEQEIERLAEEKLQLQAEIDLARAEAASASDGLSESVAAAKAFEAQVAALDERLETLARENESLATRLTRQEKAGLAEAGKLRAEIDRLEAASRADRDEWEASRNRLAAAMENLERQNSLLKNRLTEVLKDSVEFPEGSNAEAALARGNLEIESRELLIASLENQLAEAGRQRNALASSLQEARGARSGAEMIATLNAGAGDRIIAELTGQVEALKKETESARAELARKQARWESERRDLLAAREALQTRLSDLQANLSSPAGSSLDTAGEPGNPPGIVASVSAGPSPAPEVDLPPTPDAPTPSTGVDNEEPTVGPPVAPEPPVSRLIDDPGDLSTASRRVFAVLSDLGESSPDLEASYADLKERLKAEPVLTIPFEADSATVEPPFLRAIGEKLAGTSADDSTERYLVIGYASTDGSEWANRELSSRRALAVADHVADLPSDLPVEAVYFGQTRRFDPRQRAANRVVEIWRVHP